MKKLTNLSFNDNFIENLPQDISLIIPDLNSLKLANNKIRVFEDLEPLKGCKSLKKIDFADNPVSEIEDFLKKAREAFPSVEVVNCKDKDGQSVYSEPEDDNDFDEEGEMDMSEGEEDEQDDMEYGEEEFSEEEETGAKSLQNGNETTIDGVAPESPTQKPKVNDEVVEPPTKMQKTDE